MILHISSDLDSALAEAAEARGTTPDLLVEEYVREFLKCNGRADTTDGPKSLAELLAPHIGVLDSSQYGPEGATLSEDTGKKFTEALVRQREQGRL